MSPVALTSSDTSWPGKIGHLASPPVISNSMESAGGFLIFRLVSVSNNCTDQQTFQRDHSIKRATTHSPIAVIKEIFHVEFRLGEDFGEDLGEGRDGSKVVVLERGEFVA
jgi:hypothetical protein